MVPFNFGSTSFAIADCDDRNVRHAVDVVARKVLRFMIGFDDDDVVDFLVGIFGEEYPDVMSMTKTITKMVMIENRCAI